jgi:hypothetical protein
MEITMIQANIIEDRKVIIARFINRLNRDIFNVVELQHYVKLKDIVHMATNVERQIKRKSSVRPLFSSTSFSSSWRLNLKRKRLAQPKSLLMGKVKTNS